MRRTVTLFTDGDA